MANVRFSNPPTMPPPRGYTMVVEATGPGRTVYIAGQLGMTSDGKFAGEPGDFRAQATQCFENLKAALASVGASFGEVVKITNFFVDMTHLPIFFEVRDKYVNTQAPPASTAIEVSKLARDGALFEIEAIAVLPPKRPMQRPGGGQGPGGQRGPGGQQGRGGGQQGPGGQRGPGGQQGRGGGQQGQGGQRSIRGPRPQGR